LPEHPGTIAAHVNALAVNAENNCLVRFLTILGPLSEAATDTLAKQVPAMSVPAGRLKIAALSLEPAWHTAVGGTQFAP
jgi:hypothetical protein